METSQDLEIKEMLVASFIAFSSKQVFAMDSLSDFEWKNRVVLVFGRAEDQKVAKQLEVLVRKKSELDDRDMVVIKVTPTDAEAVHGKATNVGADDLKADAEIDGDGFHVVLVGKDGGIKLRSEQILGNVEMFNLIDRMPMRRAGQS